MAPPVGGSKNVGGGNIQPGQAVVAGKVEVHVVDTDGVSLGLIRRGHEENYDMVLG